MKLLILILIIGYSNSLQCSDFYHDETACIHSTGVACRWNSFTNQCLSSTGTQLGCLNYLNLAACVAQTFYPNKSIAECIFSGYCRSVVVDSDDCTNNLSRAACLGVSSTYCIWNDGCQRVSDPSTIVSSSQLTAEMKLSSISICQLISGFPAIHQHGAHDALTELYLANLIEKGEENVYEKQLLIPGCFEPFQEIYDKISCEADGLNSLGCAKVANGKCIFQNGSCQTVTDSSTLKCSDKLNQNACLSVTNFAETCYWNSTQCDTYYIINATPCELKIEVSPSVCANIVSEECFYDSSTMMCNGLCRSIFNLSKSSACKSSQYDCITDDANICIFANGKQCDRLGQNKLACQNAKEYCHFVDGFCQSILHLNLLGCASGLNQLACFNLSNPSQVCEFANGECKETYITPEDQCTQLTNVNSNACKKVTTGACYWAQDSCYTAQRTEECTTKGFNQISCLSTTNTLAPCYWNVASGSCESKKILRNDTCASLKLVNAIACKNVTHRDTSGNQELCKWNSLTYSCEVFVMSASINCSEAGLNEIACASITDSTLSCRWLGNKCANVTSLGNAISCQALQSVTERTCALVVSSNQKCKYDMSFKRCTTSVPPTSSCSEAGLNPAGCASLSASCYFDTSANKCKSATVADYGNISCDTNWPTKSVCISITKDAQYCRWNSVDNLCELQTFPVTDNCTKFSNVNKLFCLGYQVFMSRWISDSNFCSYNSSTNSCKKVDFAITGCGSDVDINLHACVGLSDGTKYCYYNPNSLKCLEITNPSDSRFSILVCKVANSKLCTQITTSQQYCAWSFNESKCSTISSGGACSDYVSGYGANPNLCASTTNDTACQANTVTNFCKIVLSSEVSLNCTTPGLNEKACLNNTAQGCYFDKTNFKCLLVSGSVALTVGCSDLVNKKGCLASLKEACYWTSSETCVKVTTINYTTVNCTDLNDQLYNAIVCGSVTTTDESCLYNSSTSHCESSIGQFINDCQAGYNWSTCQFSSLCQDWNSDSPVCLVKSSSITSVCTAAGTDILCMAVTSDTCAWISGSCTKVQINELLTCTQVSATEGKFNKIVCQSIYSSGEYCQYDSTAQACTLVTVDNNTCSIAGMNQYACISKTKGHTCQFISDITQTNFGCYVITDFSDQGCSTQLNADACVAVTKALCTFTIAWQTCSEQEKYTVVLNDCSYYSNKATMLVSANLCTYVGGNDGCVYDSTNQVCKVQNTVLTQCQSSTTINQGYCLNHISTQTCSFDFNNGTCAIYDTTTSDCSACYSFKQCVTSGVSACQWSSSSTCDYVTPQTSCTSLTNVNSIACMKFENGNNKCQFQDSGITTGCIVPADDTQNCSGLNKIACLANTAHPCFYYQICIDITMQPYTATCTSDYSFTQAGCLRIKTPGQLCKWYNGECVATTVQDTDTCATYASSIYSALVCASISTGNCYWNNGCVTGVAANCQTFGANKGACVNALAGNCIFSRGVCIDVGNPTSVISNYCNEPTNQGGCLNLNNGFACKWNGSACDYIDVTTGCATYNNVSPGVCSKTTDVACKWVGNACQAMTLKGSCGDMGLNKIACLGFTNGMCYYDTQMNQCYSIDNITTKQCTDNINENACKGHTSKCCKWESGACIDATSGSSCTALSTNSNYCCLMLVGDNCTFPLCTQLTDEKVRCYDAANITACMWITTECRWDSTKLMCISVPDSYGCKAGINSAACVFQSAHCKFFNNVCQVASISTDTCADLAYSSLSDEKCILVAKDKCQNGTHGCIVPADNPNCDSLLNRLACLDNLQACSWNADTNICTKAHGPTLAVCPSGSVSNGYCSKSSKYCTLDTNFQCLEITDLTNANAKYSCDQRNSVPSSQSEQCTKISNSICQHDPVHYRCTSAIFGTTCEVNVTQLGCAYIQNNCYWYNNSCKQFANDLQFLSCQSIYSKYFCLKNVSTSCTWYSTLHLCIPYKENTSSCSQHTDPVTSPGVCYYFSTDYCAHNGTTCYLESGQSICTSSKSPLGCQANTAGNCYWNPYTGNCLALTDITLAAGMSCPLFKYSNKQFCLAPVNEGQTCHWKDNLCQSANIQEVICISDLSVNGCRAVAKFGEQCIFTTQCEYTTNTTTSCSDKLNIYGCLAVLNDGQYCKWLGQQCSSLTDDGYSIGTHILVNGNACRKAYTTAGAPDSKLEHVGVKYDEINFVCMFSDNESDICATPGLNYYGCLRTKADTCDWNGSKCISFDFNVTYTKCDEYKSVSPKVCASITTSGQKCQYNSDTLSCETFTETQDIFIGKEHINQKQGMNRLACIGVTRQPTIWINGICYYNEAKPALTTCGQLSDVNAKSCAQIDKMDITCKYDTDGKCTTRFDGTIDKCTTPGLNIVACVQIEHQRCIYINGSCQVQEQSNVEVCSDLKNVNSLVCSQVKQQPCKFSFVNRGCVDVFQNEKCSADGLNQQGCKAQQFCSWIGDQCYCKGQVQRYQFVDCSVIPVPQCTLKQCIVANGLCKNTNCSDLSAATCTGAIYDNTQCYLNNGICTKASKCSDLFNVTCAGFAFNGLKCVSDLWNENHCVEQSCAHFSEDHCSGNCTWSQYECVVKQCNFMKKELCTGIMNNQQCFWDGTSCKSLSSCQDFMSYQTTQTQATCESQTILNKQCHWKLAKPYGTEYECTSSICAGQGNSSTNCHGTETQNEVCILLPDFSCVACTEIQDACACMSMNYCYYNDSVGCLSNPCSNLDQEICDVNIDRCSYINGECKQKCSKLKQINCISRQTSSECYWNSDKGKCLDGAQPVISINTLADIIVIESSFSTLLILGAIITSIF